MAILKKICQIISLFDILFNICNILQGILTMWAVHFTVIGGKHLQKSF